MIERDKWLQGQVVEAEFHNKMSAEEGIEHYRHSYEEYFRFLGIDKNLHNKSIIEIGPANHPALYYCENYRKSYIIDPIKSDILPVVIEGKNIEWINAPAEEIDIPRCDEIWLLNVLQHVLDPKVIIEKCKKAAKVVRFFEPIEAGKDVAHHHEFTLEYFKRHFGEAEYYPANSGIPNFHQHQCAYGVFKNDIVIRPWHGGLGDSLQFSTLPEMFSEQGHNVYISSQTPFRNTEIYDVVWGNNPFIKGFRHSEPNAGDVPGYVYDNLSDNFIHNIERLHGMEPKNDYPVIYNYPEYRVDDFGLIELSAIHLKYTPEYVIRTVNSLIKKHPGIRFHQLLTWPHQNDPVILPDIPRFEKYTLREIAGSICGSRVFISLNSGLHMLAGAMKREWDGDQYCILPEADVGWIMEQKKFVLPNVNYIIEGD